MTDQLLGRSANSVNPFFLQLANINALLNIHIPQRRKTRTTQKIH